MNKAAQNVYERLRADGTQAGVVDTMQTRAELYEHLGYHAYEQQARQPVRREGRAMNAAGRPAPARQASAWRPVTGTLRPGSR